MTPEELAKIDLNTPAFGPGSEVKPVESAVVEPTKEEAPVESVEENKVPYSRFKKFHDEAIALREEAEMWKQKAEAIKPERQESNEVELPAHWVKLYGDSPESKEAWSIQREREEELLTRAEERGREAVRLERQAEAERAEKNMQVLDRELETLTDYVGRKLTEKEQDAILDIVDNFTPKDKDGNYAGAMLPMDKAWEIYELKQGSANASKKTSRDNVASLSGNPSQGTPEEQAEKDKNFNPLDWGAWRKHI